MSNVLSLRVGKSTNCSRLLSATISRNILLSLFVYCEPGIVRSFQFMSGKLKSPPMMNTRFLAFVFKVEISSFTVSK